MLVRDNALSIRSGGNDTHLVEEVVQKLNIDKHRGCMRQFVSDDIQEYFWAENIALRTSLAPPRLECRKTQFEGCKSVTV